MGGTGVTEPMRSLRRVITNNIVAIFTKPTFFLRCWGFFLSSSLVGLLEVVVGLTTEEDLGSGNLNLVSSVCEQIDSLRFA